MLTSLRPPGMIRGWNLVDFQELEALGYVEAAMRDAAETIVSA
jgi:hypothetical protein